MNCDIEHLVTRINHGLKSLLAEKDTLPPRYLEMVVCESFGLKHVGDGNYYADGVDATSQVSVKTRMLNPDILKRTNSGRDFTTHPDKFLGPRQNKTQGKWWAGLEFVQRRQTINNEDKSSERRIGILTLRGFRENIAESKRKFQTSKTYEVLLVHGYNYKYDRYLVNVHWQELALPKSKDITWVRDGGNINGLVNINDKQQIVMHRVRGGAPREATCFKEYKDPTKYKNSLSIAVSIPDPWPFDKNAILKEIVWEKLKS
jgi:hypothetical protein